MKKILAIFAATAFIMAMACDDGSANKLEDPADVHPPSEAIPDSMNIQQDSVIVPESTNDN